MRPLLTVIPLILVLMASCTKDKAPFDDNGSQNCISSSSIKEFFCFNVGSYWVFEDSISSQLDTLTVVEFQDNSSGFEFYTSIYSTNNQCYYRYWPIKPSEGAGCLEGVPICERCVYIMKSKSKPGDFVFEQRCLFFVNEKGDFIGQSHQDLIDNKLIVNDIYDSISIGSFEFGRTIEVKELSTLMEGSQLTYHRYTKNVGLTQKIFVDSNINWKLIDYLIQP